MNIYDYIEERAFSEGYAQRMFDEAHVEEGLLDKIRNKAKDLGSKAGAKAKDFWAGNNGTGKKWGNRALAIGIPAAVAAGVALKKRANRKAAEAADAIEDAERAQKEYSDHCEAMFEERMYGAKSKLLGLISGGGYNAKEAAKYGYDDTDEGRESYKKDRLSYALKGAVSPITATIIKKKAEDMAKKGVSKDEIRKYLENDQDDKSKWTRRIGGTADALSNVIHLGGVNLGLVKDNAAKAVGLYDKLKNNRAWGSDRD